MTAIKYIRIFIYMNILEGRELDIPAILKAIGETTRLRILNLVFTGELCVCETEKTLGISQANASRHLAKLTGAGILVSRKNAQWVYYRLSDSFRKNHSRMVAYLDEMFRNSPALLKERAALRASLMGQSSCSGKTGKKQLRRNCSM